MSRRKRVLTVPSSGETKEEEEEWVRNDGMGAKYPVQQLITHLVYKDGNQFHWLDHCCVHKKHGSKGIAPVKNEEGDNFRVAAATLQFPIRHDLIKVDGYAVKFDPRVMQIPNSDEMTGSPL